jgi:uncharacterized membrane protein YphA (DoxX/SURF4 family)
MDRRIVYAKEALKNIHREDEIPLSWYEKIPSYRDSLSDSSAYFTEMLFLSTFSATFPGGWPGVGLLLLRAAVGVTVAIQGGIYLVEGLNLRLVAWMVGLLAIACGVSLLTGFLTPLASVLAGLSSASVALSWLPAPATNLFDDKLASFFVVIMVSAIFLIGPGAFSLDARMFGRREIVIPPISRSPKS